jgi:hypothetical protein
LLNWLLGRRLLFRFGWPVVWASLWSHLIPRIAGRTATPTQCVYPDDCEGFSALVS